MVMNLKIIIISALWVTVWEKIENRQQLPSNRAMLLFVALFEKEPPMHLLC